MLLGINLAILSGSVGLFSLVPTSTNYTLKNYDVGSGGGTGTSANYKANNISGGQSINGTSTSYTDNSGLIPTENSNVPPAPTFTNPANYYNQLKIVLATGNNPTDTKYLIAISDDDFVTTKYVQSDNSIGTSLGNSNYQTYSFWGGASGFNILGLSPSTAYKVKAKAMQGNFTESAYGPTSSASTVATSMTFSLTTSLTATPPFPLNFSNLAAGSVQNADADAIVSLSTNANNGGVVYIKSTNANLSSASAGSSIASSTGDLSVLAKGYGAQVTSASQASGGPFAAVGPFNGSVNNVGGLSNLLQNILATTGPITTGNGTISLKAKADSITPSANDYSDAITFTAAMTF